MDAIRKGENLWKDKAVVEEGSCEPLNDVSANYVMSLLNKGLIETDAKAEHFKQTGKAKVQSLKDLYKQAQLKVDQEMHNSIHKKKSKKQRFKDSFKKAFGFKASKYDFR